jgi:hypothetical protein
MHLGTEKVLIALPPPPVHIPIQEETRKDVQETPNYQRAEADTAERARLNL